MHIISWTCMCISIGCVWVPLLELLGQWLYTSVAENRGRMKPFGWVILFIWLFFCVFLWWMPMISIGMNHQDWHGKIHMAITTGSSRCLFCRFSCLCLPNLYLLSPNLTSYHCVAVYVVSLRFLPFPFRKDVGCTQREGFFLALFLQGCPWMEL